MRPFSVSRLTISGKVTADGLREALHGVTGGAPGELLVTLESPDALKPLREALEAVPTGVQPVLSVSSVRGLDPGELAKLGREGVLHDLLLMGPRPVVHDTLTGRKGAYHARIKTAMALWQAGLGRRVRVTLIKGGYRNQQEFLPLAVKLRVPRLLVGVPAPTGAMLDRRSATVVRYPMLAPHIARLVRASAQAGPRVEVRGVPPCALEHYLTEVQPALATSPVMHRAWTWKDGPSAVTEEAVAFSRVAHCRGCPLETTCPGVYKNYLDAFGESEWEGAAQLAGPMAS